MLGNYMKRASEIFASSYPRIKRRQIRNRCISRGDFGENDRRQTLENLPTCIFVPLQLCLYSFFRRHYVEFMFVYKRIHVCRQTRIFTYSDTFFACIRTYIVCVYTHPRDMYTNFPHVRIQTWISLYTCVKTRRETIVETSKKGNDMHFRT